MADVAANFNVFSDLEKIRSPPTSPTEPEVPLSPLMPKPDDEKKTD